MSESTGFVTLNFTETLTEPSTILNFGSGATSPPEPPTPVVKYLSLSAVVERLVTNAKAGHKASQEAIAQIVIDKFRTDKLLAEIEANASAYA
ncbi:hypothetical protein QO189_00880 [Psychrobacter sp. Arc29]|uniref:hypothetical protein n=1 Tax=Psychrobacter sp. Arc29 TaxID=3046690 RepID=UPI00352E357C